MTEKAFEQQCLTWAREGGLEIWKLKLMQRRGIPDLVILHRGTCWFFELKVDGNEPTPIQVKTHERLRKIGFAVYVVKDLNRFKRIVDRDVRHPRELR